MDIYKKAKETLTPLEMDIGDTLFFTLKNGKTVSLTLNDTKGYVIETELENFNEGKKAAKTVYGFSCDISVNGKDYTLKREIPTENSFYEPWIIDGMEIWFDATNAVYKLNGGFLEEKDPTLNIFCRPNRDARFAVLDASSDICPEKLAPWFPLPEGGLDIRKCYRGEDCWMGPYDGMYTHGGLDVNHPDGTPLYAPFDLEEQYFFNKVKDGDSNNRWIGYKRWKDGSEWIIQVHHITSLTVKEHTPLKKGEQFALGAGVAVGDHNHSHFVFKIVEDGVMYILDPWILIHKMYKNN